MSLKERLLSKLPKSETVSVDGESFLVRGLTHLSRAKCFSDGRDKKGDMPAGRVELNFLSECVCDPETQQTVMNWSEWSSVPSHITGPLVSKVRELNGLDSEDIGKKQEDTSEATS